MPVREKGGWLPTRGTKMKSNELRQGTVGAWAAPAVLLVAYLVALVLLAVSVAVDYRITLELEESGKAVSRTIEAMEKLRQTGNTFYLAESSQRGYVITGKDRYLESYREMHQLIGNRLDETSRLVSDTSSQRESLTTLRSLVAERFSQMDQTLDAYRTRGQASAIAVIGTEEDLGTMARARSVIRSMLAAESGLLDERRAAESRVASRVRTETLVASALVAMALSAFFLLTYRYLRQRDTALARVTSSNAELEQRVSERTIELTNLSRHLLNIREDEKKSIARDLHDEFGSYLTAITMDVSRMRDKISVTDPEQAAKFDRTLSLLTQAIDMKRRMISELRPSILDNLGLGAALEQYIDEWSLNTGIAATFDCSGEFEAVEEGCPIAIFRVFQEALNNIAKHSSATAVHAQVRRSGDWIDLEIADNGIGLPDAARTKLGSHGLLGIRERVLAYRGRLEISRGTTGGTVIRAAFACNSIIQSDSIAVGTTLA